MAKTVDELEEEAKVVDGEVEFEADFDVDENLSTSVDLLKQCALLLDFLADPDLCKSISKRERDIMTRMSGKVYNFTSEVEAEYNEDTE